MMATKKSRPLLMEDAGGFMPGDDVQEDGYAMTDQPGDLGEPGYPDPPEYKPRRKGFMHRLRKTTRKAVKRVKKILGGKKRPGGKQRRNRRQPGGNEKESV
jgi:hypothetical protein